MGCFLYYGNDFFIFIENKQPSQLVYDLNQQIIKNAKRLPTEGKNFKTYSRVLSTLGRTHVHDILKEAILESYQKLYAWNPKIIYIYAETGWKNGENFWPHRTHRNGLSVDFITPVVSTNNFDKAVLPLSFLNAYGYNIRFDSKGIYKEFCIDYDAIIQHIYILEKSCKQKKLKIKRIIFDPSFQKILKNRPNYPLIQNINFMKQRAWFPHDSHYHIDFDFIK